MSRAKVYFEWGLHWEWPHVFLSFELTKQIQYGKRKYFIRAFRKQRRIPDGILEGIYRMRLAKTAPVRVAHWTYITTPIVFNTKEKWTSNRDWRQCRNEFVTEIYDAKGKRGYLSTRKANENATLTIKVNKPDLWSVETPTLYTAVWKFYR
jgi:hypothetical protein